jgi:hypothetical protein
VARAGAGIEDEVVWCGRVLVGVAECLAVTLSGVTDEAMAL